MLLFLFLGNRYLWIVAWLLQSFGYYRVLKKIGDNPTFAIIPFFAEWRLSRYLYCYARSFFRPFLVTFLLIFAGVYLNPFKGFGRLLILAAAIVYMTFLFRLYNRLRKAFGKSFLFNIFFIIFPPLFLFLLSLKSTKSFNGPAFPVNPIIHPIFRKFGSAIALIIAFVEVAAIAAGIGFFTVQQLPPRFMGEQILRDVYNQTKDVVADGVIMTREEALGDKASSIANAPKSRDYYFPTHENDKNVVVLGYVIGSNLENMTGLASANITQMIDATKNGSNLSFVLETGGSSRWFTDGISNDTYGRYIVKDGKIELVELLSSQTSMSDPQTFEDFLKWAKEAYPADRYMLVLWDHGGGFGLGYGQDDYNKREENQGLLLVSDLTNAIKNSGMKFDAIGFDACLMQTFETALAFEPYADYYIASEEVEGGFGWFYKSAFTKLAQDPTIPTLDFAKELISSFDVYNTALHDGEIDTKSTLSVVDLTMVKPIYTQLEKVFENANAAILKDPEFYADLSVASQNAYVFHNEEQVDMIDFLSILNSLDYTNEICKDDACLAIADMVKASIPYRNKNSAQGVNGMAVMFPSRSLYSYQFTYDQLKQFNMKKQMDFYNNYFSIMRAQQLKVKPESGSFQAELFNIALTQEQEWYVEGFEDYDTNDIITDLPLTETEEGYVIELPEKLNKIIADVKLAVFQKDGDRLRSLGRDFIGYNNEDMNTVIGMDDNWVHIGNNLISYNAEQFRETDEGTIFTGTTRARLNGKQEIILYIEWEPVNDTQNAPARGKILGYKDASDDIAVAEKGYTDLKSGDRLDFLFDYYDENGNLLATETYGRTLYVTNADRLTVSDKKINTSDIVFFGVLTDIYQREMYTQHIEYHVN